MMDQEEFMDVKALKRQGLTILEIADATGYHRETQQLAQERWPTVTEGTQH